MSTSRRYPPEIREILFVPLTYSEWPLTNMDLNERMGSGETGVGWPFRPSV